MHPSADNMANYRSFRSVLYLPSINQRAIEKSQQIDTDWIVFDLEDSVAPGDKPKARENLAQSLNQKSFGNSHLAIRCNSVSSDDFVKDLNTVAQCNPDAVLIPKVSTENEVAKFQKSADNTGLSSDLQCWFMIETALGITNLANLIDAGCKNRCKLAALLVGHNDIASDTGVSLENDRQYMLSWLMQIVLQAKSAKLSVLDSVWNNFKDQKGFEAEAAQGKKMGFDGKTLIHPSQVEPANRIFSPTEDELQQARRIVDAFATPENKNLNVINLEGEMVERLHLERARTLLAMKRS